MAKNPYSTKTPTEGKSTTRSIYTCIVQGEYLALVVRGGTSGRVEIAITAGKKNNQPV